MKKAALRNCLVIITLLILVACSKDAEYSIIVDYNSNLGTVTPDGVVKVTEGGSKTFEIVPVEGAIVKNLIVDNLVIDPISSYTFSSVVIDQILEVVFEAYGSVLISLNSWTFKFTDQGITQTIDAYSNPELMGISECILDDVMKFDDDGTYVNKPGETSCVENYGLLGNGEWELSDNETKLLLKPYDSDIADGYDLETLGDDELVFSAMVKLNVTTSLKTLNLSPNEEVDAVMTMGFIHLD
jgi:hypothetical protein